MEITIIGTGYVGLVTGACFSEMGHSVVCVDINEEKISKLNHGIIPIYEPGLEEMVQRNIKDGRLHFTTSYEDALKNAEICFIAVSTPSLPNGGCNLDYVFSAIEEVVNKAQKSLILVVKSTVPVGTSCAIQKRVIDILKERGKELTIEVASNPEFLKEGCAISDCLKPDRIVLGCNHPTTTHTLKELYSAFTLNHDRFIVMDPSSAELTKYAANAMLATRISFMNELSSLCEMSGANINHVRIGIGSDSRIGYDFLYPGLGWGGSCFPKDIRALVYQAESLECNMPILKAVELVNRNQKKILFRKMDHYFEDKGGLSNKTVAIWGLSFKPNTDDIREAPSLELIKELMASQANVRVYDPIAMENAKKFFSGEKKITFCNDQYEAATGADAITLVTEWKQFRSIDIKKLASLMNTRAFFDGRNQYNPEFFTKMGFDYFGIGVPSSTTSAMEVSFK